MIRTILINCLFAVLFIVIISNCRSGDVNQPVSNESLIQQNLDAIGRIRNEYMSTWKAGNADVLSNLYTEDGMVLYPHRPAVSGKNAIRDYFSAFFKEYVQVNFELKSQEIQIAGSWAFDRGTFDWKGVSRNGGDSIEDHGKYLVILQQQKDGSWKVARDMDNSDLPLSLPNK